jgi:hypothetical protein
LLWYAFASLISTRCPVSRLENCSGSSGCGFSCPIVSLAGGSFFARPPVCHAVVRLLKLRIDKSEKFLSVPRFESRTSETQYKHANHCATDNLAIGQFLVTNQHHLAKTHKTHKTLWKTPRTQGIYLGF